MWLCSGGVSRGEGGRGVKVAPDRLFCPSAAAILPSRSVCSVIPINKSCFPVSQCCCSFMPLSVQSESGGLNSDLRLRGGHRQTPGVLMSGEGLNPGGTNSGSGSRVSRAPDRDAPAPCCSWTGVGRWLVNVRSKAPVGGACAVFTVFGPAPQQELQSGAGNVAAWR